MAVMKGIVLKIEPKRVKRGKIAKRYKRCLREIRNHFSAADYSNAEVIHALRVNLKRIDALMALLEFNGVKLAARDVKAIRSFFTVAGRLRSIQVEFEIIGKYFEDDTRNQDYLHQLHEKKQARLSEYSHFLKAGPSEELRATLRMLKKKVDGITRRNVVDYLTEEQKALSKRLAHSIFREQELHLIRKDLKRFYLNMKMAKHNNDDLTELLDLLGTWHDHQIAFDHIVKTLHSGNLTESEKEPTVNIKFKLINEKEALFEKIVSFYVSGPPPVPAPGHPPNHDEHRAHRSDEHARHPLTNKK